MAPAAVPITPHDGGNRGQNRGGGNGNTTPAAATPAPTDPFASQTARVNADRDELQPSTTKSAYNTVKEEFKGFCDKIFEHERLPTRRLLTETKLFGYLFYHAYRKKRSNKQSWGGFNREDYDATIQRHPPDRESVVNDFADDANWGYCQYSTLERQLNGLSELCSEQQFEHGRHSVQDYCLMRSSQRVKALIRHVQQR